MFHYPFLFVISIRDVVNNLPYYDKELLRRYKISDPLVWGPDLHFHKSDSLFLDDKQGNFPVVASALAMTS
jgi:hypothetical protein